MNPHTDTGRISIGNAENFPATRGWFVGGFLTPDAGLRLTDDVEVKWSRHTPGDTRPDIAPGAAVASLAVLIDGQFELTFPGEQPDRTILTQQGDYALWGPGVAHGWQALTAATLITIRWHATTPATL